MVPPTLASTCPKTEDTKSIEKHYNMVCYPFALLSLTAGILTQAYGSPAVSASQRLPRAEIPAQAQFIDQKTFNVLPTVLPPSEANATTAFTPPGLDTDSLKAKPFHIYDDEFYDVIGLNPTLTLIANAGTNPLFHEAVVWYPPTDEVFFVQNAGAPAAGTGLNKSGIISKIALSEAAAVTNTRNATGSVTVHTVDSNPTVINPNGGTIYNGQILFTGEGQGTSVPPNLILMNPREPYNTTVLVNNYFGRQFNSLNDISINPRNKEVYFTDTLYGYLQDFRPSPGLPNQVYRYNDVTGAVTVVADGFSLPNGVTFSPNGSHAYVTDTGANGGFQGWNLSRPASIYRYDVQEDGTWKNRKLFAFVDSGVPDGIHVDSTGNVYSGCGDGVHVWNPSGKLIGKIYIGAISANFNFAGNGRIVICADENLYYATVAASGGGYIGEV
ncbi:D-lactonohydrolase [Whalleya microplaca]|nr:D-lactonohydrolase [Whalleya microplaca]